MLRAKLCIMLTSNVEHVKSVLAQVKIAIYDVEDYAKVNNVDKNVQQSYEKFYGRGMCVQMNIEQYLNNIKNFEYIATIFFCIERGLEMETSKDGIAEIREEVI